MTGVSVLSDTERMEGEGGSTGFKGCQGSWPGGVCGLSAHTLDSFLRGGCSPRGLGNQELPLIVQHISKQPGTASSLYVESGYRRSKPSGAANETLPEVVGERHTHAETQIHTETREI